MTVKSCCQTLLLKSFSLIFAAVFEIERRFGSISKKTCYVVTAG